MSAGLLTEIADYDEPGSWGRASVGWPEIKGDVAYDMYVFANCIHSVPYGSYVLIDQRARAGATESVLRVHAQFKDKLEADFSQAGRPDAQTSIARREQYGKTNRFGNKEAAPLWTASGSSSESGPLEDVHGLVAGAAAQQLQARLATCLKNALEQWNVQFEGSQDEDPWCVTARQLIAEVDGKTEVAS